MARKQVQKQAANGGFTLIELTIVLTIIALIVGGAAQAYDIHMKKEKITATKTNLEEIESALAAYVQANGHYPCPAPIQAGYGTAQAFTATNCNAVAAPGVTEVDGGGGRKVRIGALPARTLSLSDISSLDGWNNRFTYAVTTELAQSKDKFRNDHGAITVRDTAGEIKAGDPANSKNYAHYVLTSTGFDGKGAITSNGAKGEDCNTIPGKDMLNCMRNSATFIVDDENRSMVGGAQHFDDFGVWASYLKDSELARVLACNGKNMLYNPDAPGVDAGGCKPLAMCPAGQLLQGYNANGNPSCITPKLAYTSVNKKIKADSGWSVNKLTAVCPSSYTVTGCFARCSGSTNEVDIYLNGNGCRLGANDNCSGGSLSITSICAKVVY